MGFTSLALQSGEVSTWAQKQITGTFLSEFDGMVAYTYPFSSSSASGKPIDFNSDTRSRLRSSCFAVDGWVMDPGSLWVSIFTYLKNRSTMESE